MAQSPFKQLYDRRVLYLRGPIEDTKADEIVAAMGGTFYTQEAPTLPPFVAPGSHFDKGDPLYIIEVMKMFNKIYAPFAGRVLDAAGGGRGVGRVNCVYPSGRGAGACGASDGRQARVQETIAAGAVGIVKLHGQDVRAGHQVALGIVEIEDAVGVVFNGRGGGAVGDLHWLEPAPR